MFIRKTPTRYHSINLVRLMVKKFLPFSMVSFSEFRTFIGVLDQKSELNNQLQPGSIRKLVVKIYIGTTSSLMKKLRKEISVTPLAFLHINVNLWTSRLSKDRFFGIQLFYVSREWEVKAVLLAVRHFCPSGNLLPGRSLSDILQLWTNKIILEFNVSYDKILSSTSDTGSDVKRLCSVLIPESWEWCLPHMLNCVLVGAFGTGLNCVNIRNNGARRLLKDLKKVIRHVNKSSVMKQKFKETQEKNNRKRLKHLSDVSHG
ncbi:hypothetical protein BWQ96_07182 [Gracilariopsis chorda]|uniref:Uncharacterized protein n=1 Tax=Gracilariopsis chorda TaxID=448386 RepID=A0A2V3ILY8_9FLOR|nr:hypothetical protein BWQ96_07182 [Gracilariopsis chorda]|eukprot:PXF43096.1 hypothetical protein BWQ96_07182 [Gracilariopsis chorda]